MRQQQQGADLLAEIARKNFPALLQQAAGAIAGAQAAQAKAQADYERQRSLPKAATTQQEVDAATAALAQADAQVMLAQAQVVQNSPGAATHRRSRYRRSDSAEGSNRAGAGEARPGQSESRLDVVDGAAGRLDHQAQCRSRQLCDAGPANLLDRLARDLGHRQFQGEPARPDAARTEGQDRGRRLSRSSS